MRPMRPLHGNMAAAMLVGAALLAPASGAAQERASDRFAGTGPPGPFTAATLRDPLSATDAAFDTRTPGRRVGAVFLGALGGVAGSFIGGAAGGYVFPSYGGLLAGAVLGSGVGSGLMTHLGNDRRGDGPLSVMAGAGAALVVLGVAIGLQSIPLLAAAPVSGLVAAAAVQFSTEPEQP